MGLSAFKDKEKFDTIKRELNCALVKDRKAESESEMATTILSGDV
jgi:hypothetical protein